MAFGCFIYLAIAWQLFLACSLCPLVVHGFPFAVVAKGQCETTTVTWSGGSAPYYLLLFPVNGIAHNISIPSDSFSNGQGSYNFPLPIAKGTQYIVGMGDSDSVVSSVSDLLTAGDQPAGTPNCNTSNPNLDFTWSSEGSLQQCEIYPFTEITNAVLPVSVIGLIPNGQPFVINTPQANSYAYRVNLKAGTTVVFSLIDAASRQGGVGSIVNVANGKDSSCLSDTPTTTTSSSSSATQTNPSSSSNGSGLSSTIIGGIAAGCLVVGGALLAGIFFFLRRKKRRDQIKRSKNVNMLTDFSYQPVSGGNSDHDFMAPTQAAYTQPYNPYNESASQRNPSSSAYGSSYYDSYRDSFHASQSEFNAYSEHSAPQHSNTVSGSSVASGHGPAVVQHTDIADTVPLELPPQYEESRTPLPGLDSGSTPRPPMKKKRP